MGNRNDAWFQAHVADIHAQHRGTCMCVAGEMRFVADMPHPASNQDRAAHPDDSGWFVHSIPKDKAVRIYAYRW